MSFLILLERPDVSNSAKAFEELTRTNRASNARVARLTNLVDLYVGLGGGWLPQTGETPRPADAGTDYGSLPAQVPQGGASAVKGPAG